MNGEISARPSDRSIEFIVLTASSNPSLPNCACSIASPQNAAAHRKPAGSAAVVFTVLCGPRLGARVVSTANPPGVVSRKFPSVAAETRRVLTEDTAPPLRQARFLRDTRVTGVITARAVLDTLLYFYILGNMKTADIVRALGALAQESRLATFHLLVKRGPEGYTPGELGERLKIPGPTLSFHLKELQHAKLVISRREGRFLYYSPNFEAMNDVIGHLTENCCVLSSDTCAPGCMPTRASTKRKRLA